VKIWKNTKLNIKCYVVCLWMELSYLRGSLISMLNLEWCITIWVVDLYKKDQVTNFFTTIASCEVDLHWLSCFATWITLMRWRLLEKMFQYSFTNWNQSILNLILIMKFQVTNSPIFLHNDSFGTTFFLVPQASNLWLSLRESILQGSNLETFELALTFYEHIDLQVIPWKD